MTGNPSAASPLPGYVVERLRRPVPPGIPVVLGSTPVLSFGSTHSAGVATLGLNPSVAEFQDKRGWLTGAHRRLVELRSLGLDDLTDAPDELLRDVVAGCDTYFDRNPYWTWFRQLEEFLLKPLRVSYTNGSACHLDLVQWATDPVWGHLPAAQRTRLIDADAAFLHLQLQHEGIALVLMNGSGVTDVVHKHVTPLTQVGDVTHGTVTARLLEGHAHGTHFIGWSSNLQSQPGITNELRRRIGAAVHELREQRGTTTTMTHIDKGTAVEGKEAFVRLLREWHAKTNEPTVGDVGTYGGSAWVYVELPGHTVVLNADTKREAVQEFLAAVDAQGTDLPWPVVANRTGKVNKVLYGEAAPAKGWYCYTLDELITPATL